MTLSAGSSGSTSPASSDRTNNPKKKVQFTQEVLDNEMSSERLIYDKLPMTSPPKKPPVVIDIAKLNADQGFGFNKYLPSNSDSSDQDYHQQIFESPYFDYRRAHSVVRLFFDNLLPRYIFYSILFNASLATDCLLMVKSILFFDLIKIRFHPVD